MAGLTVDLGPVERAVRLRLLLTRSVTGAATLAERLTGGLHIGTPPDTANYPYGAVRVLNLRRRQVDGPFYSAQVELQLFYRPRSEGAALQDATDVAVEALVGWNDLDLGITDADVRDSDVLPPFTEHADHEVITSRSTFVLDLIPAPTP